MKDNFSELIKAASVPATGAEIPALSTDFERRVMMEVARRAIERSRRRAERGLVASLSGFTVAAAACIAAVVVWFPTDIIISFDLDAAFDTVVSAIKTLLP